MTINNQEAYDNGIWDWGFLDRCFNPTAIKATDLDGFVERNGQFLVLETKRTGARIPQGQRILFTQFVKQGHWGLVIWGYQKETTHDLLLLRPSGEVQYSKATEEIIQGIVQDWFRMADGKSPAIPEELRPYLDRPLAPQEYDIACAHIRQFGVPVITGFADGGRFQLRLANK